MLLLVEQKLERPGRCKVKEKRLIGNAVSQVNGERTPSRLMLVIMPDRSLIDIEGQSSSKDIHEGFTNASRNGVGLRRSSHQPVEPTGVAYARDANRSTVREYPSQLGVQTAIAFSFLSSSFLQPLDKGFLKRPKSLTRRRGRYRKRGKELDHEYPLCRNRLSTKLSPQLSAITDGPETLETRKSVLPQRLHLLFLF